MVDSDFDGLNVTSHLVAHWCILDRLEFKDCLPYLFHSFRNKYFNKISLGNMLYFSGTKEDKEDKYVGVRLFFIL